MFFMERYRNSSWLIDHVASHLLVLDPNIASRCIWIWSIVHKLRRIVAVGGNRAWPLQGFWSYNETMGDIVHVRCRQRRDAWASIRPEEVSLQVSPVQNVRPAFQMGFA